MTPAGSLLSVFRLFTNVLYHRRVEVLYFHDNLKVLHGKAGPWSFRKERKLRNNTQREQTIKAFLTMGESYIYV